MKHLIAFSLKRKLFNKIMIGMMGIIFVLFGVFFFVDIIAQNVLKGLFNPTKIAMPEVMVSYFDFEDNYYELANSEDAAIVIDINEEGYQLKVDESINETQMVMLEAWIASFHRIYEVENISQEIIHAVDYLISPKIELVQAKRKSTTNGFILITSIYFFMLGFSSSVASEVVSEKTSNMLEMMLTSISHKEHYISKLLIGWITIFVQAMIWIALLAWWFIVRLIYDQGKSWYAFLHKIKLLPVKYMSFFDHFRAFNLNLGQLTRLGLSVIFLILGILLVQLILLLLSVKIENIEESGSVQAPFYLVMLGLYYGTLLINNYKHMQNGVGRILSFVPGLSMLLVPLRLLYYQINPIEILLSLSLSAGFLGLIYYHGLRYYTLQITKK